MHIWEFSSRKPQTLGYWDVGEKTIWSDESSFTIILRRNRVNVWHTPREQYRRECTNTRTVRGSNGTVLLLGAFCRHCLGPLVPLEGRVTVVQGEHLYLMMKTLYPDGSVLFQDDNAPHPCRAWGVTEWFDEYENDICHMLWPSQCPDLNPIKQLWEAKRDVLDIALNHNHQTTKWENIFWKKGVHPSTRVPETVQSTLRSIKVVLVGCGGPTLYVGFPFNLSPICSWYYIIKNLLVLIVRRDTNCQCPQVCR